VGGFNALKMLLAQPADPVYWAGKLFLIPFFIVHFGGFAFVHGVLVVAFFGPKGLQPFDLLTAVPAAIRANQLRWGLLSLVASHGFSFYWNYLKNGEYQRASLNTLMGQPYGRVLRIGAGTQRSGESLRLDQLQVAARIGWTRSRFANSFALPP